VSPPPPPPPSLVFRHPTDDDHLAVAGLVRAWSADAATAGLLSRLWFRHFGNTSWLAETDDGRIAGFAAGVVASDRPVAHLQLVAVDPNLRRRGIGRALVDRFLQTVRERGATEVEAVVWAGDRPAIAFALALGFLPDEGAGSSLIYGVPAYADYDAEGDDKARLVLRPG
jgi:ribosomal protein S18 acetylase RimI-like enzyme